MRKGIVCLVLLLILVLTGCTADYSVTVNEHISEEPERITYEAMMYGNAGNRFLTFIGNKFTITPNKIKQYG